MDLKNNTQQTWVVVHVKINLSESTLPHQLPKSLFFLCPNWTKHFHLKKLKWYSFEINFTNLRLEPYAGYVADIIRDISPSDA
jgi:hypothetical protein